MKKLQLNKIYKLQLNFTKYKLFEGKENNLIKVYRYMIYKNQN